MRVGRVGGWVSCGGVARAGRPAHDTSPQAVAMVRDGGRRGCVSSGWWRAGLTVRGAGVAEGVIVRAACRVERSGLGGGGRVERCCGWRHGSRASAAPIS